MALSPRAHLPYPDEQRDPWFEQFLDMVQAVDANIYAEWEDRNMPIMGGGVVAWNAITSTLSWAGIIELGSAPTGFLWRILPGSVTVNDGEYVYVQVVRSPINNVVVADPLSATVYHASQVPSSPSQDPTNSVVIARRDGATMYFRNGATLPGGGSGLVFEEGGGGPENFSYKTVIATKKLTVPQYQQMAVFNGFENDGEVVLDGEMVLL